MTVYERAANAARDLLAAVQEMERAKPVPSGDVPRVGSYNVITARVGVSRSTFVGNLGPAPYDYNQPSLGLLAGTGPNLTYHATSPGQDSFTVRDADGNLHAFFMSVFP